MDELWDERIEAFWKTADDADPERVLSGMKALMAERPDGDPAALFEWAGAHDFLGLEEQAVPLYRRALDAGLDGERRPQAVIQLASSLRNSGQAAEAVELLEAMEPEASVGSAREAFLALALHDAGRPTEALTVALLALQDTLPLYGNVVGSYARDLGATPHA
ncbi:tetratricopeptide repeat protein [Arthrobacter rhombi]|uniref:tetratricopeptide repeat protein n=1 Tax=Arthrobacter rhombi TaxID=71253 RepID=UPI0031DDEE16